MNRREVIIGVASLPIIPYIKSGYKTPLHHDPYEKLNLYGIWEEFPFDNFKVGDIVRRIKQPTYFMKVLCIFPDTGRSSGGVTVETSEDLHTLLFKPCIP